ncbi:MAG TPA: SDR family oxidoreductase [Bdellovibrionota bacterium]|jgi:short-subunit dehydrogenase|nr:SDR family oxidoreductase [Bdellovibrionota bacterium]
MSHRKIAIVTGASSGIGAEIARHLPNVRDLEIWLVARRRERLSSLAESLRARGAAVEVLALDLQDPGSWAELENRVRARGAPVGWLINNAGIGYSGRFEEQSVESIVALTQLNINALVVATRRLVPFMERGSRIVNVASGFAYFPVPGHAIYAATKAFVLSFSLALREELSPRGISVTAVCPGPVVTEFWESVGADAPPSFLTERAERTAQIALEQAARGRAVVFTGALSRMASVLSALLPRTLMAAMINAQIQRLARKSQAQAAG